MLVKKLQAVGGNLWQKGDHKRIYFNADILARFWGLEIDRYNTGNISYAAVDGKKISNSSARRFMASAKMYYDAHAQTWHAQGVGNLEEKLVERIVAAAEAADVDGIDSATSPEPWEAARDKTLAELNDLMVAEIKANPAGEAEIREQMKEYEETLAKRMTPAMWEAYKNVNVEELLLTVLG